jgi:hypothetical protein
MLTLHTRKYAYVPTSGHHPSSEQKFSFAPEDGIQKNFKKHTFRVRNQNSNANLFSTVHCTPKHATCKWAVIKNTRYGNCDLLCSEDFSPGKHYISTSESTFFCFRPNTFSQRSIPFLYCRKLGYGRSSQQQHKFRTSLNAPRDFSRLPLTFIFW